VTVDDKKQYVHVVAWVMQTGLLPEQQIDHKDGVRSNNRWSNLRPASASLNKQNMRVARADNCTGLLGVGRAGRKFRASISIEGSHRRHLGVFPTAGEAHEAYLAAKRTLHPGCTI
jgi:hypothetical protein